MKPYDAFIRPSDHASEDHLAVQAGIFESVPAYQALFETDTPDWELHIDADTTHHVLQAIVHARELKIELVESEATYPSKEQRNVLRAGEAAQQRLAMAFAPFIYNEVEIALQEYTEPGNIHAPYVLATDRIQNGFTTLFATVELYTQGPVWAPAETFMAYARGQISQVVQKRVFYEEEVEGVLRGPIGDVCETPGVVAPEELQDTYPGSYTISLEDIWYPHAAPEEIEEAYDTGDSRLALAEVYAEDRPYSEWRLETMVHAAAAELFSKFSPSQRIAFAQRVLHEQSYESIAALLDENETRIKTYLQSVQHKMSRYKKRSAVAKRLIDYLKQPETTYYPVHMMSGDQLRTGRGHSRA